MQANIPGFGFPALWTHDIGRTNITAVSDADDSRL
jgi:hypothetical protein